MSNDSRLHNVSLTTILTHRAMSEPYINIHSHRQQNDHSITVLNIAAHALPTSLNSDSLTLPHYFSIGIHPWFYEAQLFSQHWQAVQQFSRHPNCVAIGECGLDHLITLDKKQQIAVFARHIELALELNKPLMIHCVRAYPELLKLKQHYASTLPWIVHGFNKYSMTEALLNQDCYLSLGYAVLRPNHPLGRLLPDLPLDRLFLETDDTEMPTIDTIYQTAAKIAGWPLSALKQRLYHNFKRIKEYDS